MSEWNTNHVAGCICNSCKAAEIAAETERAAPPPSLAEMASRRNEIQLRLTAATPGRWRIVEENPDECTVRASGPVVSGVVATVRLRWVHADQRAEQAANAQLLAHARDDLEWALARIADLERLATSPQPSSDPHGHCEKLQSGPDDQQNADDGASSHAEQRANHTALHRHSLVENRDSGADARLNDPALIYQTEFGALLDNSAPRADLIEYVKRLAESVCSPTACFDCGLTYGDDGWIECVIPDVDWRAISPSGDECGILCITCISRRLKRLGRLNVAAMICGTEAIRVADQDEAFERGWGAAEKRIKELKSEIAAIASGQRAEGRTPEDGNESDAEEMARPAMTAEQAAALEPPWTRQATASDTERLDWALEHDAMFLHVPDGLYVRYWIGDRKMTSHAKDGPVGSNGRAAIDAARLSERGPTP